MAWLLPPLPPNFEAALRDVHGKRPESRMAAAQRLGQADGEERDRAIDGLLTLARDAHPSVRATALAAIGMLADARCFDAALDAMDDVVPDVRELATLAVAQIGGERAQAAMRAALESGAPEVRFQAIAALAELEPEAAAKHIVPLLGDTDPEVRGQVIAALGSLDEAHLSGHLAGALDDDAPMVRLEAALALARLGDKRGERLLLDALEARVRVPEVADALATLGITRANDLLARLAMSFFQAPDVRAVAGAALVRLGDVRGLAALRRVLRGLRSDARSYAVQLVAEADAEALVGELVRLASRPRGTDPYTLVAALAKFADRSIEAKNALARLVQGNPPLEEAARRARIHPPPEDARAHKQDAGP